MIKRLLSNSDSLAGIQYAGQAGISSSCLNAIKQIIQMRHKILSTRIVTHQQEHGFIFTLAPHDLLAVKAGFASGYAGEGPRTFSKALQLLEIFNTDLDEYSVTEGFLSRLNSSRTYANHC